MSLDVQGKKAPAPAGLGLVDGALVAVMFIWGGNMIAVKLALAEMNPMAFNSLRFLLATATMLVVLVIRERDLGISRLDLRWLLLTGLVGNTVYQLLFINGINLSTAGNTAFMVATAPVWVAVIGKLWGLETLSRWQWVGVFTSLAGVTCVVLGSGQEIALTSGTVPGDLLTLTGAMCWAGYTVMTRPVMSRHSPLRVTAYAMILGTGPLVLIGMPSILAQDWGAVTPLGWGMLVYGSIGALVVGYLVWGWGVQVIGSTRTAIYNNLTPVVAGILGYLMLSEVWTLLRALGAAGILVGLYLVRTQGVPESTAALGRGRRESPSPPPGNATSQPSSPGASSPGKGDRK